MGHELLNVKLEIDVTSLTVTSPTHDFVGAKVESDDPCSFCQVTVEADTSDSDQWIKEVGDAVNEMREPFWAGFLFGAILLLGIQFLQEVLNGKMVLAHSLAPSCVVIRPRSREISGCRPLGLPTKCAS